MLQEKISERDENLTPTKQKRERLMYRIMDFINEHYAEPLTLKKNQRGALVSLLQKGRGLVANAIHDATTNRRGSKQTYGNFATNSRHRRGAGLRQ